MEPKVPQFKKGWMWPEFYQQQTEELRKFCVPVPKNGPPHPPKIQKGKI